MAGEDLIRKALGILAKSAPSKVVTDPAERAANLVRFMEPRHPDIPDVMYHGKAGEYVEGRLPNKFFLTPDPTFAEEFAYDAASRSVGEHPNIMPLHVGVKNPFDYNNPAHINFIKDNARITSMSPERKNEFFGELSQGDWHAIEHPDVQRLIKPNFDAFFVREIGDDGNYLKNLGVYKPDSQLKSATGNAGTFDPNIPRLNEASGGKTVSKALQAVQTLFDSPGMTQWREKSVIPASRVEDRYFTGTSKDKDFPSFNVGRHGAWFTKDPAEASSYAKENDSKGFKAEGWKMVPVNTADRVIPAYLRAENPFTGPRPESMLTMDNYKKAQSDWFDQLRAQGHDAWMPESAPDLAVILKEPSQIKSAISNSGDFDLNAPRTDRADGGHVDAALHMLRRHFTSGGTVEDVLHAVRRHFDGEDGSYVEPAPADDVPTEPRPLTIYRGKVPVADEAGGSGREPTPAPPAFSYMPMPESVARQAARQPAPETKWPHEAMTEGERLISNLGAEDLPKGETFMSAQPSGWEKYKPQLRQGTYLKRTGEAFGENADAVTEGLKAIREGNYGSGALGMVGGGLGMAMSPLTGMERVLVRDPYLRMTGNLKDAQAAEMAADVALTGGVRGMVTPLAKAGSLERMATEPWNKSRMPSSAVIGAGVTANALTPDEAEASKLSKAMDVARMAIPRELSPLGFYSHGAEAARGLAQAKGTPEQMLSNLRRATVKPEELYHSGMVDPTATLAKRTMIESEYAPKVEAAKQAMDALNPGSPEFAQALLDPKSAESKAKRLYDNTVSSMRKDMDSAMVLSPEWASRPSVTSEEIAQHFKDTMPKITERVNYDEGVTGPDWTTTGGGTRFGEYALPGGENYREVLLKIPPRERTTNDVAQLLFDRNMADLSVQEGRAVADYMRRLGPSKEGDFTGSHWQDPNVVAHLRMSDRTGPNGEKILHVEEIQSDWAQKARGLRDDEIMRVMKDKNLDWDEANKIVPSDFGFKPPADPMIQTKIDVAKKIAEEAGVRHQNLVEQITNSFGGAPDRKMPPGEYARAYDDYMKRRSDALKSHPEFEPSLQHFKQTNSELGSLRERQRAFANAEGVPAGPYVGKTPQWTDLALKRALKEAAEGGYDRVVFTPGAEQAKRWDLQHHVDNITWSAEPDGTYWVGATGKDGKPIPGLDNEPMTPRKLRETFGSDIAKKIMKGEGKPMVGGPELELSGLDLQTGEGMRSYYDKIVPKRLQELIKKHDPEARVGLHEIPNSGDKLRRTRGDVGEIMNWHPAYTNLSRQEQSARWNAMTPPERRRLMDDYEKAQSDDVMGHGIDITPAMRESILRGQSAHARGGEVVDQALHAVREHHADGEAVGPVATDNSERVRAAESAANLAKQIQAYEASMANIRQQPQDIQSMTHAPEKPRAPISVEALGKNREFGSAPYDVAGPLSTLAQGAYDLKTAPLYAFPPTAPLGMAIDTAEGVASGSPTQVAMGALGGPLKVARNVIAPLAVATGVTAPDEAQAIFAGRLAKIANLKKLALAEQMAKEGFNPNEIIGKTDWFQAPDGKWRFEIPDAKSKITDQVFNNIKEKGIHEGVLPAALEHPELYAAYPQLNEMQATFGASAKPRGSYSPWSKDITVEGPSVASQRSTALHEAQHAVQQIEGFARGADNIFLKPNTPAWDIYQERLKAIKTPMTAEEFEKAGIGSPEYTYSEYLKQTKNAIKNNAPMLDRAAQDYAVQEAYRRSAGETEARNVQARRNMEPSELQLKAPWETQSVPYKEQLVQFHEPDIINRKDGGSVVDHALMLVSRQA